MLSLSLLSLLLLLLLLLLFCVKNKMQNLTRANLECKLDNIVFEKCPFDCMEQTVQLVQVYGKKTKCDGDLGM